MKIQEVTLRRLAMPLVKPFRTSFGTQSQRDVLLVQVHTDGDIGYGECVAMSIPLYSEEYVIGAQDFISRFIVPRLFQREIEPTEFAELTSDLLGNRMAKAAVEMSLLDAWLKSQGISFADYLRVDRDKVPVGVSIGIADSIDGLLSEVNGFVEQGYRRIKLKIEPEFDLAPTKAVREEFPDILLQVDANQAYKSSDIDHLVRLDEFDLLLIEQPMSETDIAGHIKLAKQMRTPVCLDESITSAAVAKDLIDLGATSVVNIKPGRVGGYLEAVRIHDVCQKLGVPVWCGGMLETGIGRAANLALAGLPGFSLPGDISGTNRYWNLDITQEFVVVDGHISLPSGLGFGAEVNEEVLLSYQTEYVTLSRP
jgi:O-succinylbenzoate synthase